MGFKKLAWIIPVAITGTIVLVLGGIYLSIMDHGKSDYTPDSTTNKQLLQRQLVRAFADIKEKKVIDYNLNQDSLNQLLYNAMEGVRNDDAIKDIVGDFYVKIKGNKYTFYLNANLKIVKTRVVLDTKLVDKDDDYVFEISNIKLGNFPAKWIVDATGVLKSLDIGKVFSDFGLSIQSDIDNNRLIYPKKAMKEDMVNLMSSPSSAAGTEQQLLKGALETFDFEYSFDAGIHAKSDLSDNIGNSKISDDRYVVDDPSKTSNHNSHYKSVLTSIDATMTGYEAMLGTIHDKDEELADHLKDGLNGLRIYGDDTYNINKDIHDNVSTHAADYYQTPGFNQCVASISETNIDNFLRASDIIGKHYVMRYQKEYVYVVLDNMFCDIFTTEAGSFMNFSVGININGLETHAIIETKCAPIANSFKANFGIENIYYGSELASETFATVVKDMFKQAVNPENPKAWVSYDGTADVMTMDFEKVLDEEYQTMFSTKGTKTFYLDKTGSSITDNGALELWFAYSGS